MSTSVTDFIVAGPPGQVTAGPPGSFMVGGPGRVVTGEPGHVPIDTTPAHVPIDTSSARIPYTAAAGRSGMGGISTGSGGSGGGSGAIATGGGGGGFVGGGGAVSGGGGTGAIATGGGANTIGGGGGGTGSTGNTGGSGPAVQTAGGVIAASGGSPAQVNTGGGGGVDRSTGGGSTGRSGGSGAVAASAGGGGTASSGGGSPHEQPPVKPDNSAGFVAIAPTLGVQSATPGGYVPIMPALGVSLPTPAGSTSITPSAGHVQAFRSTFPHGTFFGHIQNGPSEVYHHVIHNNEYMPERSPHAAWIPTSDGYAASLSRSGDGAGPVREFDFAPRETLNIDLSSTHETNAQLIFPLTAATTPGGGASLLMPADVLPERNAVATTVLPDILNAPSSQAGPTRSVTYGAASDDGAAISNGGGAGSAADGPETRIVSVQPVTNLFDATGLFSAETLQAPEREGGDIFVGNA